MRFEIGSLCEFKALDELHEFFKGKECTVVAHVVEQPGVSLTGASCKPITGYRVSVHGFDRMVLARHEWLILKRPPSDAHFEEFLNKLVQPLGQEEMDKLRDEMKEKEEV